MDDIRERVATSPFHTWMGMRVTNVRDGEVDLALDATSQHLNLAGALHGGVLATLADTAAGLAVRTTLPDGARHVTVHLDVQYLRAGGPGTVTATGRVLRAGSRIAFAEASLADAEGQTLARAHVTIAVTREAT